MNETYMISKMNEYMFRLSGQISNWLEKKLPKITDKWWNELVYNNLSTLQRDKVIEKGITDLKGLDLAALLRVFDRNWFVITSSVFVNGRVRYQVKKMISVRNRWAHISKEEISRETVLDDMKVIIDLMQSFDATGGDTNDMEQFAMDVEDDKDIPEKPIEKPITLQPSNPTGPVAEGEIVPGSMVFLVSNSTQIGAVIAVSGSKYSVLLTGKTRPQTFYREQIKLLVIDDTEKCVPVGKVKSSLTAYQINNPSSSNLYSLGSARIDFVPYQFRPALKLIKAETPRLLIADDVGVGKTIEAGLILKELEARSSINSVLIICPRPLVAERKWELEMKRFDEDFTQMDGKTLQEAIEETDRDGSWPDRHKKTIIPYSLFGEDMIMGTDSRTDKRRKKKGLSQLDPLPHFDLVIVDEAHNIRNANTWAYQGVELFTRNADAVVFLTATPLQNSNNDLYTLLNLLRPDIVLDKDTFNEMAEPNEHINGLLRVVRNPVEGWQDAAKEEITGILNSAWGRNVVQHNPNFEKIYDVISRGTMTREERIETVSLIETLHTFNGLITRTRRRDIEDFCVRRTQTIRVPFTSDQENLYEALIDFESTALGLMHGKQSVRFMMCTIMRQAASCIYGLAPFVNDIVAKRLAQVQEDGELFECDFDLNTDDENSLFELADEITELSSHLRDKDPKLEQLLEIVEQKQREENNRIILFSSFRHTLAYVRSKLEEKGYRVAQVDGSVPDEERYKIRERFQADRNDDGAVDILLFSEVGCEGLDYQFCDTMVNYDLPWNPMRIEQRIGRIDRRGQKSETVRIYNMITEGTIDAVIYDRCLSKIGVFEASIGDCSDILGDISEQIFKIMFDPTLTDEERQMKIEKMADNEVMKVQEMNRLEQDEKSLFGFDLSNYIHDKDVQDAENAWISPQSISDLVQRFLVDYLGEGEYIRSNKVNEIRTMRISGDKRQLLLEGMTKLNLLNSNTASRLWNAYLKAHNPQLKITYDAAIAKDNREVTFLTQMHPLVLQAAEFESRNFPCEMGISVDGEGIPAGDYDFLIYAWRYVGLKPDIKLIAISDDALVQENVLNYIQYADDYEYTEESHAEHWDSMDQLHYEAWNKAKEKYVSDVKDACAYRIEQLRQSNSKREMVLRQQIANATDDKILRMRNAQLENMKRDYENQKRKLEETVSNADIHMELLVKGVLHIE